MTGNLALRLRGANEFRHAHRKYAVAFHMGPQLKAELQDYCERAPQAVAMLSSLEGVCIVENELIPYPAHLIEYSDGTFELVGSLTGIEVTE